MGIDFAELYRAAMASDPEQADSAPRAPAGPDRRCVATSRSGERCKRWAIKGGTVCRTHGGAVKRVREAAERREADRKALEVAERLDVAVPEFTSAGEAARWLLQRITARSAQFGRLADQRGDDLSYTDAGGVERLRAAVLGEQAWLGSLSKVLAVVVNAESAGRDSSTEWNRLLDDAAQVLRESVTTIAIKYHGQPITDPGAFTDEVMDQCARRTQMYEKARTMPKRRPAGTDDEDRGRA